MIGILFDDILQTPIVEELFVFTLQVQGNARTTLGFIDGFNFVIGLTGRGPSNALGLGIASPSSLDHDFFCNDKGGIKTDPELTN